MKTILQFEYGSRAHGTNTVDSDSDFMGIFVESPKFVTGMYALDTVTANTAASGVRSTSVDTDTTLYPLRKFAKLAAHGNPTVLTAFFAPSFTTKTTSGERLLDASGLFISQQAGRRFLGYMTSQRDAMTGVKNKRTNRPELVHTYGYDTKFAYHMIRLGLQGIELMHTGTIQLPMTNYHITRLLAIRRGELDKAEVMAWSYEIEQALNRAIDTSKLQEEPDADKINALLHEIYIDEWNKA